MSLRGRSSPPRRLEIELSARDDDPPAERDVDWPLDPPTPLRFEGRDGIVDIPDTVTGILSLSSITADGVDYPGARGLEQRAGGQWLLCFDPPQAPVLKVVDRRTGVPIPDARVHRYVPRASRKRFISYVGNRPPADMYVGRPRMTGPDGTLALEAGTKKRRYYVVAPGYAWQGATVYPALGGVLVVGLSPGGHVRLTWSIPDVPNDLFYWLEIGGGDGVSEGVFLRRKQGVRIIDSLPAGRLWFQIWSRERKLGGDVCRGGTTVDVAASETVLTAIAARELSSPVPLTITGRVFAPGWDVAPTALHFSFGAARPGGGRWVTLGESEGGFFSLEQMRPGRWRVQVKPFEWLTEVVVSPSTRHFRLVVPDPRALNVRIEPAPPPNLELEWRAANSWAVGWVRVARTLPRTFGIRTAADSVRLRLRVLETGIPVAETLLDARDSSEPVIWRVPLGGIRATLRVDESDFGGAGMKAYARCGNLERWVYFAQGIALFDLLAPGVWSVSVGNVAGFRKFEASVTVRPGRCTPMVVDLTRH